MIVHIADAIHRLPTGSVLPSADSPRMEAALERLIGRAAARRLLGAVGSATAMRMPAYELAEVAQVPLRAAERVVAARDLARAMKHNAASAPKGPGDIARLLPFGFETLETEVLLGFAFTPRLSVKAIVLFAKGGDVGLGVMPRDIFVPLARLSAAAVVIAHNHPSGDPTPSPEDVDLTNRVAAAGKLLGIAVLDHLIVTTGGTLSFRAVGLMPTDEELGT